ncbi:MAG: O-antigen ligase family protein [Sphingomicrobium sp.]
MKAFGLAKKSLLLFAFSLFWMKDPLIIGGLPAIPADLIFVVTAMLLALAWAGGESRPSWSAGFVPLILYFGALAISAIFAADLRTSAFKVATQAYLIAVPVLVYNLVETWDDLRRLFLAYLAGAAVVAFIGVATLLLFPFFGHHSFLAWPLHHFGTLPPGPYPRLEVTFEYPAMMANYLALALMLLILAERQAWIAPPIARLLGGGMLLTALFALTPGFGGLLLMLGVWFWHREQGSAPGRLFLSAGLAAGVLGALVAAVTPILHRTAPFLIWVPGLPVPLAPAVRLLAWMDAARTFLAHPLVGIGIGGEPVHVPYVNPSGEFTIVTDAHNMPLSIAAQTGIVGVIGMAAILVFAARETIRGREIVFGLSLAFLSGLVVEGLVGSFEDARHLWLAYGLMLVARKLETLPDAGFAGAIR